MKACTRCGAWHAVAEERSGRALSCTEVKSYWSGVSRRHKKISGHDARVRIQKNGRVICITCRQELGPVLYGK